MRRLGGRLYRQIYLAFFLVASLCLFAGGAAAWLLHDEADEAVLRWNEAEGLAQGLSRALADADADAAGALLEAAAAEHALHLALLSPDGGLLASAGSVPRTSDGSRRHGFRTRWAPGFEVPLEGGRRLLLVGGAAPRHRSPLRAGLVLLVLAGAAALGCYPVARRITRRLEALREGVERWGEGELTARAPVEGADEVAEVARSFNRAAERVEELVDQQRRVLAGASHELRSPLARIRMAVELAADPEATEAERARRAAQAAGDIEELDALIDDLLLGARLDVGTAAGPPQDVDLAAEVRSEAERLGLPGPSGELHVPGDPRLLRRLARNLLENALRHGARAGEPAGAGVEVGLDREPGAALLVVQDRGPGVAPAWRERIFEPFVRPEHREGRDPGVGLGLTLVRRIAEHHGGTVRCVERPGGGARFEVRLPVRR